MRRQETSRVFRTAYNAFILEKAFAESARLASVVSWYCSETPGKLSPAFVPTDRIVLTISLAVARDLAVTELLSTPCRRDQIGAVASLSNSATSVLRNSYAYAISHHGERANREPLLAAHLRYRAAVLRYDDAAQAMNDAIGSVLFHPFGNVATPSSATTEG